MAKNSKIVNYKKPFNINIGLVVFVIIFIYIVFNIFSYFTKTHISVYEVEQGTIAENNTYKGLAIRSESVFYADTAGSINYYMKDSKKASYNSLIYSIDETGDIAKQIQAAYTDNQSLDSDSLNEIGETITDYSSTYNNNTFFNVYSFKDSINAQIMESLNLGALNSIGDYTAYAQANNTFHLCYAQQPGLVAYYTDGFADVTVDSFEPSMLNELNYSKNNLKAKTTVATGDPVYKLLTDETWYIVVPINTDTYERLLDSSVVQVEFTEDGKKIWVNYEEREIDNAYYLFLTFHNSMVRYASERYIEIELLLDEKSGLKIPNSAIAEKEFYTVPKEYFSKGEDSSSYGLLVKDSSTKAITYVDTTIYYETDDAYFIDEDEITGGTIIQKPDSNDTYTIGETASLQGVYNINKGYAVFKQLDILYQNEEYAIVSTGTNYGISLYDHIALEGSKVNENDLIN